MELFKNLFNAMGDLGKSMKAPGDAANALSPRRQSKHHGATKRPMYLVRQERRAANKVAKRSRKANRRG